MFVDLSEMGVYLFAVSEVVSDRPIDFFQSNRREVVGNAFRPKPFKICVDHGVQ